MGWVGLGFVLDMTDFFDFVILVIIKWLCLIAKLKLSNCLNGV